MIVEALVLPDVSVGKIDASTTCSPPIPWTRTRASTAPLRAFPECRCRRKSSSDGSPGVRPGRPSGFPDGHGCWPCRLHAQQKSSKRIGVHQRALARRSLGIADRRKEQLHVRMHKPRPRPHEPARLVDVKRQRHAPGHRIAQAVAELAVPSITLIVQGQHPGAVEIVEPKMVLQVPPYPVERVNNLDTLHGQNTAG